MIIFCYSLSNSVGVFIHFEGVGILMIDFNIDCCFIHFCRNSLFNSAGVFICFGGGVTNDYILLFPV
jgi:hypothetical protein